MFKVSIDISELNDLLSMDSSLQKTLDQEGRNLAAATHAHIIEEANNTLHSRRELFIENLTYNQDEDGVWQVVLDAKAVWINDGAPGGDMLQEILSSARGKSGKNGRYARIAFQHNKQSQASSSPAQADLIRTIKSAIADFNKGIPAEHKMPGYGKLHTDADGKPKTGLVHQMDIQSGPKSAAGTGLLQRLQIYQKENQKTGKVDKTMFTIRMASESQAGKGMWQFPPVAPTNLLEKGYQWAYDQIDTKIVPKVLASLD